MDDLVDRHNNDFEKQIHAMFDTIWDCEIDHSIFQDTVGELMGAVIQCYKGLPSAQPKIIRCKDCKHHWTYKCMDSMPIERCDLEQTFYDAEYDFCSLAERRTDELGDS